MIILPHNFLHPSTFKYRHYRMCLGIDVKQPFVYYWKLAPLVLQLIVFLINDILQNGLEALFPDVFDSMCVCVCVCVCVWC